MEAKALTEITSYVCFIAAVVGAIYLNYIADEYSDRTADAVLFLLGLAILFHQWSKDKD
jgi:hypothetical protein